MSLQVLSGNFSSTTTTTTTFTTTTTTHCWQLDEDWVGYAPYEDFSQVKHWKNTLNTYRMMRLDGDALELEASGNTDRQPGAQIYSKFHVLGDFDVELHVEDCYLTDPVVTDYYVPIFYAHEVGGSAYLYVARWWDWSPSTNGFLSGGSATGGSSYSDGLSEFKLRIRRVGSVFTVFVWDSVANQWEWNGSTSGRAMSETFTGAVRFEIRHDKADDQYAMARIVKFKINEGSLCAYGTDFTTSTTTTTTTTTHTTTTVTNNTTSTTTTLIFETDFSEYTSDVQPSDWSERWYTSFHDFWVKDAPKSIGGKKMWVQCGAATAAIMESWDDLTGYKDVEILTQVRHVNSNGSNPFAVYARASGSYNTAYAYGVRIGHGGTGKSGLVSLIRWNNGTLEYLTHDTGFDHVSWAIRNDRRYLVRFRVRGHRIYAKVWDQGRPEPTEWMLKASDTLITSGGWVGTSTAGANDMDVDVQFFNVTTHGGTARYPSGVNDRGQHSTTTSTTTTTTSVTTTTTTVEVRDTQIAIETLGRDSSPPIWATQVAIEALQANTTSTTTHWWEEDFSGMTIEQAPTDWTESWDTTNVDTLVKTGGKDKVLNLDKTSNAKIAVIKDVVSKYNIELLGLIQAKDAFSTFAGGLGARVSGGIGTETGYVVFMDPANDKLKLRRYNNGTSSDLANGDYTVNADAWYWIRMQCSGSVIKAKMWTKFGAEPGTWLIDHTDSSPLTSAGEAGVCCFNADANCDYIAFEGWDAEWPIPVPAYTTTTTTSHTTTTTTFTTTTQHEWETDFSELNPGSWVNDYPDWHPKWDGNHLYKAYNSKRSRGGRTLLSFSDGSGGGRSPIQWIEIPTNRPDIEILIKVKWPVNDANYIARGYLRCGGTGDGDEYGYFVEIDNGNDLSIGRYVAGAYAQVAELAGSYATDTWYWMRFRANGNDLKAKIWQEHTSEPGAWSIETTDSNNPNGGFVGIGSNSQDTEFDWLSVAINGGTAPGPHSWSTTTTTTSSTTSTTTTCLMDEFFTGSNGAAVGSPWTFNGAGTETDFFDIQSNALRVRTVNLESQGNRFLDNDLRLIGDFDIQVDFDTTGTPAQNHWYVGFGVKQTGETTVSYYVYYNSGTYYRLYYGSGSDIARSEIDGKLRIVRRGSTLYFYYWSSGAWVEHTSWRIVGHTPGPSYPFFVTAVWTSIPDATVTLDNFRINRPQGLPWPCGSYIDPSTTTTTSTTTSHTTTTHCRWDDPMRGDEGGMPNSGRWFNSRGKSEIVSNKLRVAIVGDAVSEEFVKGNFLLPAGDFDINIEWSNWTEPTSYGGGVIFDVRSAYDEGAEYLQIARNENATGNYIETAGSQGSTVQNYLSATSGKFRIRRLGTQMTSYYDVGSGWVAQKQDSGYTTGRMIVRLRSWQYNALNALSMDFNNFKVTTGCKQLTAFTTTSTTSTFTSTTTTTYCVWDDHFNRKNNAAPNPNKWYANGGGPGADGPDTTHMDIWNKQLRMRTGNIVDTAYKMRTYFTLTGDFSFEIDFNVDTGPATNSWWAGFGCTVTGQGTIELLVAYYNGQKYRVNPGQNDYSRSENPSGKLRITRSGTTVNTYKWNGSSWDQLGSGWSFYSGAASVILYIGSWNSNPNATVSFNNLRINTCSLVDAPTTTTTTTYTTTTTTTHTSTTSTTTTSESGVDYSTNWSEYTSDVAPTDWTELWELPVAAITVKDDGGQYGAKYLLIDHSTYGHYLSTWDDISSAKDTDIVAKVQFGDENPVTGDDYFKIVCRQTGGNSNKNGYEVRLYPDNDEVKLYKWVSNSDSQIGSTKSFTFTTYWYWVRFQVRGNNIKVKVWAGQPSDEPGTWDIETTDSAHEGVYGTVGLGSYNGDATRCDYFAVGVGAANDAPFPADYLTTTTTSTTTTATTTTGTTETPMEPPWYTAVGTLQTS